MFPGQSVLLESPRHGVRNRLDGPGHGAREPVRQVLREQRDVVAPLAQRRERDREDIQSIVEIVPESILPDFVRQITIGGGNDPHVDVHRARAAQSLELSLLQNAQQLWLQLDRKVADFVQEQRPSMSELEPPGLARMRSRERAALASEQLALDQRGGQRRAVERDEFPRRPRTAPVNRARDQLLASPGLAQQQHGGMRGSHLIEPEHHVAPCRTFADERVVDLCGSLAFEHAVRPARHATSGFLILRDWRRTRGDRAAAIHRGANRIRDGGQWPERQGIELGIRSL